MQEIDITQLPPHEVLIMCTEWKDAMVAEGKWDVIQADFDADVLCCPVHQYAKTNGLCKHTIGGTVKCSICGHYMCPGCMNHAVDVMSRVTGYLSIVSGWNAPKSQEFEDRKRYVGI